MVMVLAGLSGALIPQRAEAGEARLAPYSAESVPQIITGVLDSDYDPSVADGIPAETAGAEEDQAGQAEASENQAGQAEASEDLAGQAETSENQTGQPAGDTADPDQILAGMTLEQKIEQMFVISPEALTGVGQVTQAGDATWAALQADPVGGLIYMEPNIQSVSQVETMLAAVQNYSRQLTGLPLFLCVDEEGGSVRRISGHIWNDSPDLDIPDIPDMLTVGQTEDLDYARQTGTQIGTYLKALGFNVDFAPDADVVTDPSSSAIGTRSFGPDPVRTADMVAAVTEGIRSQGIGTALKHFPGHGAAGGDSHQGVVTSDKTLDQLREEDLIPFQSGIAAGSEFVMAGHISYPNITGSDVPASLSKTLLTDVLRGEMGYQGLVITDALAMGAITNNYGSADAAVMAVSAGVDMLLMPADFRSALEGVEGAVADGRITEDRIDQSVRRIISLKLRMEGQTAGGQKVDSQAAESQTVGSQQADSQAAESQQAADGQ